MKTRKLTLCALAAIAAMATSCSNDEPIANSTTKGIVIEATAHTPASGVDTRVAHQDEDGSMKITWAMGDTFTAYASDTNNTSYLLSSDPGTASASFTGTWDTAPAQNATVYAIYPTNASSDPATINLSLEGQNGSLSSLANYNYMTTSATYKDKESLAFGDFNHQVAIVKLTLTFPDDVTATQATHVGIKATGLNKSVQMDLTNSCAISNEVAGDITTGTAPLTITNKTLTAYLCIFPGSIADVKAVATAGGKDYEVALSDLDAAAGTMYKVNQTVAEAKKDYIEVNGIKVAVGNLIADGTNNCKIGAPGDGGLFFQFGSLVGWAGGASGDGTGRGTGTTIPARSIVVKPDDCTVTAWSGSWTGDFEISATDDAVSGKGDPCRYYLKGTWRLPTNDEYVALFNNVKDNSYANSGGWDWNDTAKSAIHTDDLLTFPASGYRNNSGNLSRIGAYGYYWSASPSDASEGYSLRFYSSSVSPSVSNSRAYGLPVRCVK